MGVSSPIVARGPAHPIAQAARAALFSRSHGATHVKRVPGVVSHLPHGLKPPAQSASLMHALPHWPSWTGMGVGDGACGE